MSSTDPSDKQITEKRSGGSKTFPLRASHRLTLDLWLAKDNRFLNPKSSYERILMAPPCRLILNLYSLEVPQWNPFLLGAILI